MGDNTGASARFGHTEMPRWLAWVEKLRGRIDRGEPFKWFAPYVDGPPS